MSITNYPITVLILLSLTILLLFRLIRLLTDKFISKISVKQWAKKVLYVFELVVWIILIYQVAEKSLSRQPILSAVMILLLVFIVSWSFWFVLRDYLAGIYIRISGRFKLHETIAFNSTQNELTIKGKIIRFGNQNMVLETQNLTTIELPYNKLFNIKMERHVQSVEEELSLSFQLKTVKDSENLLNDLRKQLLELPWISHKQEPVLILNNKPDDKTYLELKVILLDKKYRNRVEEILTNNFGK